ncbi:MAG: SH3 domain-containing protein [Sulfuricurvum sp.]|nr:SH3 domain-containing protein [Sulfuricurvum sp.]MDP3021751.1 SH3 domain-containing protein [Sulfuricurvum sp.]
MQNIMYRVSVLGVLIFLHGCAQTHPKTPSSMIGSISLAPICNDINRSNDTYEIALPQEIDSDEFPAITKKVNDLEYFPQVLSAYFDSNFTNQETLFEIQKHFEEHYYAPWTYAAAPICVKEAKWPISAFSGGYGNNLKPVNASWIRELINQSNYEVFSTVNERAITTKWMDIRVFPTQKPLYKNPAMPGEGYPFDLLQNSSVAFNEPVFISHYSKDGSWVYIFTNNASGWVQSDGVAVLKPDQIALIQEKKKVFVAQDGVPLYDEAHKFVTYSRIGMVLPLIEETPNNFKVLFVRSSGVLDEMYISKESSHLGYHLLNKEDLIKIGSNMLRNTYGWGGMFEERDCSSMIRDFFTPFGIWLPRNSASQAKKGEVFSFNGLDNTQKLSLIKEKGVPFETILYKKGHVLLYIGTYEGNVMVMHNIWGIRTIDTTGKKGRVIIGKTAITTLQLGQEVENFDPNNMLLSKLVSMNIITHTPVSYVRVKSKRKTL